MQAQKQSGKAVLFQYAILPIVLFSLCIGLSGCGQINIFGSNDEPEDLSIPIRELLANGMREFNRGKYFVALKYFDKILDMDPFSPEATLAELKAADSHYFMEHFTEARMLYEEFEERHPTNEAIPYILYQKGMCSYRQISRVDRDVSGADDAIRDFTLLLKAYPSSPYSGEAQARIRAAKEFLVNHEFFVVQFYIKQKKYSQAEVRLKYIINMYPESTYTPKAKELLAAIQEGNPPSASFFSWLPEISLPNWLKFSDPNTDSDEVTRESVLDSSSDN